MKRIVTGHDERVGSWVCSRTGGVYTDGATLGLEEDGKLVAGVIVDGWNGASARMHVAGDGNWLNREFLFACFDYVFRQLNLNVVIGIVPSDNAKALRFDKHLGFKELARIPKGHPAGDLVILTLRKEDCRYVGEHRGIEKLAAACA